MRVIFNPYNPKNREVMNKDYGIQLPLLVDKQATKVQLSFFNYELLR